MPRLPFRILLLGLAIGVMFTAGVRMDRVAARSPQAPQPASSIGADILKGLSWRSIGPLRGGRSITISGVKGRPKEGYFGATGGGLWKTTDGGESWMPVTDGQIHSSSVGALAVSESNPDVVFIGMSPPRTYEWPIASPRRRMRNGRRGIGKLLQRLEEFTSAKD